MHSGCDDAPHQLFVRPSPDMRPQSRWMTSSSPCSFSMKLPIKMFRISSVFTQVSTIQLIWNDAHTQSPANSHQVAVFIALVYKFDEDDFVFCRYYTKINACSKWTKWTIRRSSAYSFMRLLSVCQFLVYVSQKKKTEAEHCVSPFVCKTQLNQKCRGTFFDITNCVLGNSIGFGSVWG